MQTDTQTRTPEIFPPGAPPEPAGLEVLPARPAPTAEIVGREARRYDPRTTPEFTPFACSEDIAALVAALTTAQSEFGVVGKNQTAKVESRREGARSYSYRYADLHELIRATQPALNANGLSIVQLPIVRQRTVTVLTLLCHTSGQWMRNDLPMVVESLDPQSIGTAFSYGRRYARLGILDLAPGEGEDDDYSQATQRAQGAANGHESRPGQGPVQMPQRAERVSPPPTAQTPAPPSASTTGAGSTPPATPAPARAITITHLEKIPRDKKTPWWRVKFSDGTIAVTFSTTMGGDLEVWKEYGAQFSRVRTTPKDGWTYLEACVPVDGPRGGGR